MAEHGAIAAPTEHASCGMGERSRESSDCLLTVREALGGAAMTLSVASVLLMTNLGFAIQRDVPTYVSLMETVRAR
jgi:hypothetical protein